MDDEVKGKGNSVNYKYRMHDPRIGRFFAVDPLAAKYPHNSSYAFSENMVIHMVELEGLEATETSDKKWVSKVNASFFTVPAFQSSFKYTLKNQTNGEKLKLDSQFRFYSSFEAIYTPTNTGKLLFMDQANFYMGESVHSATGWTVLYGLNHDKGDERLSKRQEDAMEVNPGLDFPDNGSFHFYKGGKELFVAFGKTMRFENGEDQVRGIFQFGVGPFISMNSLRVDLNYNNGGNSLGIESENNKHRLGSGFGVIGVVSATASFGAYERFAIGLHGLLSAGKWNDKVTLNGESGYKINGGGAMAGFGLSLGFNFISKEHSSKKKNK
ncbi:MAG: hypothetical protein HRT58_00015 [Crocinitomicaceae bacterium]|nr:hypothetical protein [Flavobacteriales bacterium]NQZ34004.1 hypothetical protein [Crocinitomicaceae bacterium]